MGFINLTGETQKKYVIQIREQRKKLKSYVEQLLRNASQNESQRGVHFDSIYKDVCRQFENFYTKEFVFKVIDELFQMGAIYEVGKLTYSCL